MTTIKTSSINKFPPSGEYFDKVDRVMTKVDRIAEDIAHMPLAAFIIRNKESDEVHYSTDIRYLFKSKQSCQLKLNIKGMACHLFW